MEEDRDDDKTIYRTILADPPWSETGGGKIKRGADRHYPVMKTDAIIELMKEQLEGRVAEHAHLYLWVTNNFLPDGLRVMEELGFTYKTNVVWAKSKIGLGQYFRGQHEICLFGVKGKGYDAKTDDRTISSLLGRSLIRAVRHSQKPDEMHRLIEQRSKGPYLELFARTARKGWSVWGDEI